MTDYTDREMHKANFPLAAAFPAALRREALSVLERFPEPQHPPVQPFRVRIGAETVEIPHRIYNNPEQITTGNLTDLQRHLIDCLLTRHWNGFIRQKHLNSIIGLAKPWVPPFVIQLLGEYVVDIIAVIHRNLNALDRALYREFLTANPKFFAVTVQRVTSYWDRYYREYPPDEYIGFKTVDFFRSLIQPVP